MFRISPIAPLISCILFSLHTSADTQVDLVFADFRFQVPSQLAAIGVQDNETFLAIRYGNEPGRNYLTFTNQPTVPTNGCPPEEFFSKAMELERNAATSDSCDASDIQDFRTFFLEQSESGVWKGQDFRAYYLLQDEKSMVYLNGPDRSFIKVDTDFLNTDELKSLIENAERL